MTANERDIEFDTLIDKKYLETHFITVTKKNDGDYVFTYADTGVVLGYVFNAPAGNIFLADQFILGGNQEEMAKCRAGFHPGLVKPIFKTRRSLGWTTGENGKPVHLREEKLCWLTGNESAKEFREELNRRLVDTLNRLVLRLPKLREKFVWRQKQIRTGCDDYNCIVHLYTAFDLEQFVNKDTPFSEVELLNGHKVKVSLLADEDIAGRIYRRIVWLVSGVDHTPFIIQGYMYGEGELSRVCFLKDAGCKWFKEAVDRL